MSHQEAQWEGKKLCQSFLKVDRGQRTSTAPSILLVSQITPALAQRAKEVAKVSPLKETEDFFFLPFYLWSSRNHCCSKYFSSLTHFWSNLLPFSLPFSLCMPMEPDAIELFIFAVVKKVGSLSLIPVLRDGYSSSVCPMCFLSKWRVTLQSILLHANPPSRTLTAISTEVWWPKGWTSDSSSFQKQVTF